MGRKIFVSYKYADSNVQHLQSQYSWQRTTVRDYVDELENYFDESSHIYKGESDDEDLSHLSEDTIWEKLKDKIYDSSVTIVMISPNMREEGKSDRSQWIPWEVAFSLREKTRNDRTSHSNAMLAIVLPDSNGSYNYYLEKLSCGVINHKTDMLFKIIKDNKFNIKEPNSYYCYRCGGDHYLGECSYIEAVKWCDFVNNPNKYIDAAVLRQINKDDYDIKKDV